MSRRRRSSRRSSNGDLTHSLWEALVSSTSTPASTEAQTTAESQTTTTPTLPTANVKSASQSESLLFFLGDHKSGKSFVLNSFLNGSKGVDKVKPTVALDYTYARKLKRLVHLWELGGRDQRNLVGLLPIVLNEDRLQSGESAVIVIVFDLNRPGQGLESCHFWVEQIRALSGVAEEMRVVIIGNKYDLIRDQDPLKKKMIAHAFRHVSIQLHADLVFTAKDEKTAVSTTKALLSHYAFGSAKKKTAQLNHNKPLYVPQGMDSLEALGNFPAMDGSLEEQRRYWKEALFEHFPTGSPEVVEEKEEAEMETKAGESEGEGVVQIGPVKLAKETAIDRCFAKKMKELDEYKRASQREKRAS